LKKQKGKGQTKGPAKKRDETKDLKEEEAPPADEAAEQAGETAAKPKSPTGGADEDHYHRAADSNGEVGVEKQSEDAAEILAKSPHKRQPSLSLQSKMRSSSFRRSSVSQGPLSPNGTKSPELPVLTPDGDSVNSIYRKQAARLDELEKENRRLAKESQEADKRWRHTEEELEELREASGEVAELKSRAQKAEAQMEEFNKLVRSYANLDSHQVDADHMGRNKKTPPSNARTPSSNPSPDVTSLRPAKPPIPPVLCHPCKPSSTAKALPSNPWKWRSRTFALSTKNSARLQHRNRSRSPLSKIS